MADIYCIFQGFLHRSQHKSRANQMSLTFFLQEGFSGGQWTLTYFWVLQKFHSSGNLGRDKCDLIPHNEIM